jgi:serine/threonine protein kinase
MAVDATRCPSCGAELPANAPAGLCSSCLSRPVDPTGEKLASTDVEATLARTITAAERSPEMTNADARPFASRSDETPDSLEERPRVVDDEADCISIDQFVEIADDLGLIDAAEARAIVTRLTEAQPRCNSRQLGRELVAAGKLTSYQAGAICQGKAKGLLIGRYTVLDKLGAGGMGMVFKVQHRRLKQVVALKILPPSLTRNPELVQRFHREAETAAKLNHPNIVRAIDADDAGGTHFLVMEFVEGTTVSKLVRGRGVFSPAKALDTMVQAARGLAVAHDGGIVHRDIKPSNLMIDTSGVVKILDLGLARLTSEHSPDGDGITLSGSLMGTVDYMSPEQAFDPRLADSRSDIYSLGCTLHFLLTSTEPYRRASLMQRLLAHRESPVPSLCNRRPDVSAALDRLFREMVAKDPKDRPGSMAELINRLEACKAAVRTAPVRNPRPLMIFDNRVRIDPPSTPSEASAISSGSHVDPTPLPRMSAADIDTPKSGSGIRLDDKKQNTYAIYETDSLGLHSWIEFVRSRDAIPASVSVYECGPRPAFAAVALPNRRQVAWEFATHSEMYQFNNYSNTMASRGLKLSFYSAYHVASRSGIISHFRKTDDTFPWALDIDLAAVHTTLERIEKSAYRLIYLAGYPTPLGRRFAVFSTSPSLYPQRYAYELTFDALKVFATRAKPDGYLPISLTASPFGESSRFSIILEKVADCGCELSLGLTQETLANEFDRRTKRGFSPMVFCGFTHANSVLYNVGWIQGRLPKGL